MDRDTKILGCLLGAAVGDAMGASTEFLAREDIIIEFKGPVTDFVPAHSKSLAHGLSPGTVTDDFSLGFFTAKALVECKGSVNERIAINILKDWAEHSEYLRFAGPTTMAALKRIKETYELDLQASCNTHCATNGAAMKIFSAGLINPENLEKTCADAVTLSLPTHANNAAISAACAVACAVSEAMKPNAVIDDILTAGLYGAERGDRLALDKGLRCASPSIIKRIRLAAKIGTSGLNREKTMEELGDIIGSGISAAESIPCAFGILAACPGDLMGGIRMGVNIGSDTDTIASIFGAIGGTLYGSDMLPENYLSIIQSVNHLNIRNLAEQISAMLPE